MVKRMSRLKVTIIVILDIILQSTVFSRFNIDGISINLSIPVIISLASSTSKTKVSYIALVIDLIEDIMFSNIIGIRALVYFLMAFFIADFTKSQKYNRFFGVILTLILTYITYLFISLIFILFNNNLDLLNYLKGPIFVEMLLNSIIFIFVNFIFKKLSKGRRY